MVIGVAGSMPPRNAGGDYITRAMDLFLRDNHRNSLEGIWECQDSRAQRRVCDIENTEYHLNKVNVNSHASAITRRAIRDLLASFCSGFVG